MTPLELLPLIESEIADNINDMWDVKHFEHCTIYITKGTLEIEFEYKDGDDTSQVKSFRNKKGVWHECSLFTPAELEFLKSAFRHMVYMRLEAIEIEDEEKQREEEQEYDEWNEHGFASEADYWSWKL